MAKKSIAGLSIHVIQVKGAWSSQGGVILAQKSPMTKKWIPHWNIVVSYALSHLCISNNTSEIWYIKSTVYYQYDINSDNNNSRGSCNRPYKNITFLRHTNMRLWSACSLRSLARAY